MRRSKLVAGSLLVAGFLIAMASASKEGVWLSGNAECSTSRLVLTHGPRVSEATGQGTLILRLMNTGSECVLDGYPRLSFYDRSGLVPFRIRDAGDQMITSGRPHRVVVRESGIAFVALNKYRCDLGDRGLARMVRLALLGRSGSVSLSLTTASRPIAWCGRGDPGSTIDVTPFEPTLRSTRA